MTTDRNCCRIFPLILLLVSIFIALAMWYFEEGSYSFSFLIAGKEVYNVIGAALFIAALPIGIFYLTSEKERFSKNARSFAWLGFLPALVFFVFMLL
jgi:hypothetical protein